MERSHPPTNPPAIPSKKRFLPFERLSIAKEARALQVAKTDIAFPTKRFLGKGQTSEVFVGGSPIRGPTLVVGCHSDRQPVVVKLISLKKERPWIVWNSDRKSDGSLDIIKVFVNRIEAVDCMQRQPHRRARIGIATWVETTGHFLADVFLVEALINRAILFYIIRPRICPMFVESFGSMRSFETGAHLFERVHASLREVSSKLSLMQL